MADRFPKGSAIRRLNSEPAVMAAAGRALLLQLANPAVAQGVQDHSQFKRNPFARLQGTLEAAHAVVFGTEALAERVGRRLHFIHGFVTGPGYEANDPRHLMWVHATLVDSALWANETFLGPLDPADAESYYRDMKQVGRVFGIPLDAQPDTLADFRAYVQEQVDTFVITDVAKDLIGFILAPPALPLALHIPLDPVRRRFRLITLGSLPDAIRTQLDDPWDPARQRRYERTVRSMRRLFRTIPQPIRTGPVQVYGPLLTLQARRHVREFEAKQAARAARAEPAA